MSLLPNNVKGVDAYSILGMRGNNILFSKSGMIGYVYLMELPEKYSLSESHFDQRNNDLISAFKNHADDVYIHKQDVYLKKGFNPFEIYGDSFLLNSVKNHFAEREGIFHYCLLSISLGGLKSLEKSYLANPTSFKKSLHREDAERILQFENWVKTSLSVLNNIRKTKVSEISEEDLKFHIYQLVNGFEENGFYDIDFRDQSFGESKFDMYSFSKAEYFNSHIQNVTKDEKSLENNIVYEGIFDVLGETLKCNHVYNQILYLPGTKKVEEKIRTKMNEYGKVRSASERLNQTFLQYETLLENVSKDENKILCYCHSNLLIFNNDSEGLKKDKNTVDNLLSRKSISFYKPKKEILKNLFLGSILGRESKLAIEHFFIAELKQALFLWTNTQPYKSDSTGVYFNERLYQLPSKVDIWDEENIRIPARNGIIVATTGGGKSTTALNIITQYMEMGINCVIVEFGNSFETITKLYPERSAHITYSPEIPLGINPFDLNGEALTKEKLSYLTDIILKCWRNLDFIRDNHVKTSIDKMIPVYYNEISSGHSYENFYFYMKEHGLRIMRELEIKPEYFDLDSFLHIHEQYVTGGLYENIFKVSDTGASASVKEKQLVVFELTTIKKDPFLVTLVLMLVQDTLETNILSDRGKKGALFFDEFAESQSMKDVYSDVGVLNTVSILFQKIRKENGCVYIIIQDMSQLPDNQYTKSIIANTQVLIVLPSNNTTYSNIERQFELEDHEKPVLRSLRSNIKTADHKYTELWINFLLIDYNRVMRLELSREQYFAFQTNGSDWSKLQNEYLIHSDMKTAINQLIT